MMKWKNKFTLWSLVLTMLVCSSVAAAQVQNEFKAVVFDGFALFDPNPAAAVAQQIYPERGNELISLWRVKLFDYQWIRALSGQYLHFEQLAEQSLIASCRQLGLELSLVHKGRLLSALLDLKPWPDSVAAIKQLKNAGFRVSILSNMTKRMLDNALKRASLQNDIDAVISTDLIQSYKPAAHAYQLGLSQPHISQQHTLYVAFAGWDAAGAAWYGYPVFWLNRAKSTADEFGTEPDATGYNMKDLMQYLRSSATTSIQ